MLGREHAAQAARARPCELFEESSYNALGRIGHRQAIVRGEPERQLSCPMLWKQHLVRDRAQDLPVAHQLRAISDGR